MRLRRVAGTLPNVSPTWDRSMEVLENWGRPAEDIIEAMMALELSAEDYDMGDTDGIPAMIKAALGWIIGEQKRRAAVWALFGAFFLRPEQAIRPQSKSAIRTAARGPCPFVPDPRSSTTAGDRHKSLQASGREGRPMARSAACASAVAFRSSPVRGRSKSSSHVYLDNIIGNVRCEQASAAPLEISMETGNL